MQTRVRGREFWLRRSLVGTNLSNSIIHDFRVCWVSLTEYRGFPSSSKTGHLLLIPQQEQATCQTSPLSPVTGGKQAELFSVQRARDFEN